MWVFTRCQMFQVVNITSSVHCVSWEGSRTDWLWGFRLPILPIMTFNLLRGILNEILTFIFSWALFLFFKLTFSWEPVFVWQDPSSIRANPPLDERHLTFYWIIFALFAILGHLSFWKYFLILDLFSKLTKTMRFILQWQLLNFI